MILLIISCSLLYIFFKEKELDASEKERRKERMKKIVFERERAKERENEENCILIDELLNTFRKERRKRNEIINERVFSF